MFVVTHWEFFKGESILLKVHQKIGSVEGCFVKDITHLNSTHIYSHVKDEINYYNVHFSETSCCFEDPALFTQFTEELSNYICEKNTLEQIELVIPTTPIIESTISIPPPPPKKKKVKIVTKSKSKSNKKSKAKTSETINDNTVTTPVEEYVPEVLQPVELGGDDTTKTENSVVKELYSTYNPKDYSKDTAKIITFS